MEYIEFQGKKISMLGYGAMRLPTLGNDDQIDYEEAERLFDRAIEAGINYFDTAYGYLDGQSEIFVGKKQTGGRTDIIAEPCTGEDKFCMFDAFRHENCILVTEGRGVFDAPSTLRSAFESIAAEVAAPCDA